MKNFLMALILLATPASAKNGEFLHSMCQSAQANELSAGFCLGAIGSILQVMQGGNSINGMSACFPPDLNTMDAINTVVEYLDRSGNAEPNLQEFSIPSAVATIFWIEFPCD